jgi:SUMO ligase MMS21 Smc5/6 complex component
MNVEQAMQESKDLLIKLAQGVDMNKLYSIVYAREDKNKNGIVTQAIHEFIDVLSKCQMEIINEQ